MKTTSRWIPALALLAVAACIFCFSTGVFSAANTAQVFGSYNFLARKLAHVSEYALLFLVARFALSRAMQKRSQAFVTVLAILLAAGFAATDEWHQTFVPGRSGSIHDMLIDWAGVMLGYLFFKTFQHRTARGS